MMIRSAMASGTHLVDKFGGMNVDFDVSELSLPTSLVPAALTASFSKSKNLLPK